MLEGCGRKTLQPFLIFQNNFNYVLLLFIHLMLLTHSVQQEGRTNGRN